MYDYFAPVIVLIKVTTTFGISVYSLSCIVFYTEGMRVFRELAYYLPGYLPGVATPG